MDANNSFFDILVCNNFGGEYFKRMQASQSPNRKMSCFAVIQNLESGLSNISIEVASICDGLTWEEPLSISCKQQCTLQMNIKINVKTIAANIQILFTNMTIVNSSFVLQNIKFLFRNVTLENVDFTDMSPRPGELGQILLEFSNCFIHNTNIKLNKTAGVSMLAEHSTGSYVFVNLTVLSLFLSTSKSYFSRSNVYLSADAIVTILESVKFEDGICAPLGIHGNKLVLYLKFVIIENSAGGLIVTKRSSGMIDSWLEAYICHSVFTNNTRLGSGGAVMISFVDSDYSHSADSVVDILYSVFIQNTVKPTSGLSKGGALAILYEKSQAEYAELHVLVSGSVFVNNIANEGGGAIYSSQGHTSLVLYNSTFQMTSVQSLVSSGLFLSSYSDTSIDSCGFSTVRGQESSSILDLQLFNERQSVKQFTATITCPQWYSVSIFNEKKTTSVTGEDMLKRCSISCSSCSPSFYFPSDGHFLVSYNNRSTNVEVIERTFRSQSNMKCLKCPTGAECPGNYVKAKPNFWGYESSYRLKFYRCPLGYCCQDSAENGCDTHDSCSQNREGLLCGKCKPNFAISIFSENCIPEEYCNASWVWPLAVCAAVLYMLWYTFKDVILETTSRKVLQIFQCYSGESLEIDKGYFGILIYFVQTQVLITLSLSSTTEYTFERILNQLNFYLKLSLTFELSTVSRNVCPSKHFTQTSKIQLKFLFLLGIYIAWAILYSLTRITQYFLSEYKTNTRSKSVSIQDSLFNGLIEIMKYTYSSLSDVMFYSLLCVMIQEELVWYFDGSEKCFSVWQICMIIFGLLYVFPFPLALFVGLRKLRHNQISSSIFVNSLFLPGPFLTYWFLSCVIQCKHSSVVSVVNVRSNEVVSKECSAMFERFRGGYRISKGGTQYWECVVICRRLALCSTILIPNLMVRLFICLLLNGIIFFHHVWIRPFICKESNSAEALSLFLLVLSAAANWLKSSFIQGGAIVENTSASLFQFVNLCETLMLPSLILYVCLLEIHFKNRKVQSPR